MDRKGLPDGWSLASLEELSRSVSYGFSAKAKDVEDGPRYLRITDIQNGKVDWTEVPRCDCSAPDKYQLAEGDIVVARTGATTGKNFRITDVPDDSIFASYLIRLSPMSVECSRIMSLFMNSEGYWQQIQDKTSGIAQPGVNASKLKSLKIPLPPLNEQRRIADKIDALQAKSRRAHEALETVGPLLEKFRQSVLAAAFRGDLTAEWRKQHPDVEPAEKLLERIRAERRARWEEAELAKMRSKGIKPKNDKWKAKYKEPEPVDATGLPELPEGWCWAALRELAEIKGGLTKGKKRKVGQELISTPYLRVANVQRGFLDLQEMYEIDATPEEIEALRLIEGDVLFNEGGDRDKLGRGWVWDGQIDGCIHQNHVFRARLVGDGLQPKLVSRYSNTFGQDYFFSSGKQMVNLASLSMTKLGGLPIPILPTDEASMLDDLIEKRLASIDAMETGLNAAMEDVDCLDQSILVKAFRGELVPQDPNDEPASVLLERIKEEREAAKGKKK